MKSDSQMWPMKSDPHINDSYESGLFSESQTIVNQLEQFLNESE